MKELAVRRLPLALVAVAIAAGAAIWILTVVPAGATAAFDPRLTAGDASGPKVEAAASAPYTAQAAPKRVALLKAKLTSKASKPYSKAQTAEKPRTKSTAKKSTAKKSTAKSTKSSSESDLAAAKRLLRSYTKKYPILKGSTVSIGNARGHQAICYYQSGRIVISPKRKASIKAIMAHEIWHIIDWRDNGRIDWGESIPPKNASSYAGR